MASSLAGRGWSVNSGGTEETDGCAAAVTDKTMALEIANVRLRLRPAEGARVQFVKQVAPTVKNLTGSRTLADRKRGDYLYPTGAWRPGESRDYHIGVQVDQAGIGQEMRAAQVSLVASGEILGQCLIRAIWTDDDALSTKVNPRVAHYTGQAELAQAIQEGLEGKAASITAAAEKHAAEPAEQQKDQLEELVAGIIMMRYRARDLHRAAQDPPDLALARSLEHDIVRARPLVVKLALKDLAGKLDVARVYAADLVQALAEPTREVLPGNRPARQRAFRRSHRRLWRRLDGAGSARPGRSRRGHLD